MARLLQPPRQNLNGQRTSMKSLIIRDASKTYSMVRTLPATAEGHRQDAETAACVSNSRNCGPANVYPWPVTRQRRWTANGRSPALYWKESSHRRSTVAPVKAPHSVTTGRHPGWPDMACLPAAQTRRGRPGRAPLSPGRQARKSSATSMAGCGCVFTGTATARETKTAPAGCRVSWRPVPDSATSPFRAWVRKR